MSDFRTQAGNARQGSESTDHSRRAAHRNFQINSTFSGLPTLRCSRRKRERLGGLPMQRSLVAVVEVPRLLSKTEEASPLRSFRTRGDLEDYQP